MALRSASVLSRTPWLAVAVTLALAGAPRIAFAEDDVSGAEALLKEALALEDKKQWDAACPKLEESLQHYASVNTEYFLADCYEHVGKIARAWLAFDEVAKKAHDKGEAAKEKKARDRADKIDARVARLTFEIGDGDAAGLVIKLDGVELAKDRWKEPLAVEVGEHTVDASAPGRLPWSTKVTVSTEGARSKVAIPALEPEKKATPSPAPEPMPPKDTSSGISQSTVGIIVGAGGLAAMGVGTLLAFGAKSKYHDSDSHCGLGGNANACDQTGLDIRDSARSRGNVATIVFGVGAAVLITGGVLFFTAPKGGPSVSAGVGPGTFSIVGRF